MSTNSLSHITVDRKHLNASKVEGLACGIGLQRIKSQSNSPGGLRVPTSAMGNPDGPTTRAPAWRRRKEAVKESVKPSVTSNRRGLCYQSDLTPKFKFGGKRIKTEVRKDEKWENGEGHT